MCPFGREQFGPPNQRITKYKEADGFVPLRNITVSPGTLENVYHYSTHTHISLSVAFIVAHMIPLSVHSEALDAGEGLSMCPPFDVTESDRRINRQTDRRTD